MGGFDCRRLRGPPLRSRRGGRPAGQKIQGFRHPATRDRQALAVTSRGNWGRGLVTSRGKWGRPGGLPRGGQVGVPAGYLAELPRGASGAGVRLPRGAMVKWCGVTFLPHMRGTARVSKAASRTPGTEPGRQKPLCRRALAHLSHLSHLFYKLIEQIIFAPCRQ
jgi:hypothetical protein